MCLETLAAVQLAEKLVYNVMEVQKQLMRILLP